MHEEAWNSRRKLTFHQDAAMSSFLYILRFCSLMWRFSGFVEPVSQPWMVQVQLLPPAPPSCSHSQNTESVRLQWGTGGLHNAVTQHLFFLSAEGHQRNETFWLCLKRPPWSHQPLRSWINGFRMNLQRGSWDTGQKQTHFYWNNFYFYLFFLFEKCIFYRQISVFLVVFC